MEEMDEDGLRMKLLTTVGPMVLARLAGADLNESHWIGGLFGIGNTETRVASLASLASYSGELNPVVGSLGTLLPKLAETAEGTRSTDVFVHDAFESVTKGVVNSVTQGSSRSPEDSYFFGHDVAGLFGTMARPALDNLARRIESAVGPIRGSAATIVDVPSPPSAPSTIDLLLPSLVVARDLMS